MTKKNHFNTFPPPKKKKLFEVAAVLSLAKFFLLLRSKCTVNILLMKNLNNFICLTSLANNRTSFNFYSGMSAIVRIMKMIGVLIQNAFRVHENVT